MIDDIQSIATKRILIVRGGKYTHTCEGLNTLGVQQMQRTSEKIALAIGESMPLVLSSTARRSTQSANILAKRLGVEYEAHSSLWNGDGRHKNLPAVLGLVRSSMGRCEVLILVTHYSYTKLFPVYFVEKELKSVIRSSVGLECGGFWDLTWDERPRLKLN